MPSDQLLLALVQDRASSDEVLQVLMAVEAVLLAQLGAAQDFVGGPAQDLRDGDDAHAQSSPMAFGPVAIVHVAMALDVVIGLAAEEVRSAFEVGVESVAILVVRDESPFVRALQSMRASGSSAMKLSPRCRGDYSVPSAAYAKRSRVSIGASDGAPPQGQCPCG